VSSTETPAVVSIVRNEPYIHPKAVKLPNGNLVLGNKIIKPGPSPAILRHLIRRMATATKLQHLKARWSGDSDTSLAIVSSEGIVVEGWHLLTSGPSAKTLRHWATGIAIALAAVLLAIFLWVEPVGAEPNPNADFPATHDNTVAQSNDCVLDDAGIHICRMEGGPRWVNLDVIDVGRYLATGTWTLDVNGARPWLRIRDMQRQSTFLVAPSDYGLVLVTGTDGQITGHDFDNTTMTRPEFREQLALLTGSNTKEQ